jgi:hypothetical protein
MLKPAKIIPVSLTSESISGKIKMHKNAKIIYEVLA